VAEVGCSSPARHGTAVPILLHKRCPCLEPDSTLTPAPASAPLAPLAPSPFAPLRLHACPGNVNAQVKEVCDTLEAMEELRGGFNMVGFSQGGQFLRVSAGFWLCHF
jgi:hypothetical protein